MYGTFPKLITNKTVLSGASRHPRYTSSKGLQYWLRICLFAGTERRQADPAGALAVPPPLLPGSQAAGDRAKAHQPRHTQHQNHPLRWIQQRSVRCDAGKDWLMAVTITSQVVTYGDEKLMKFHRLNAGDCA